MALKFWESDSFQEERLTMTTVIIIIIVLSLAPFAISDPTTAFQTFLLGIILSALYLTTSIGFSLIFGVAKQFKLSVGGYYVIGAYMMLFLQNSILIHFGFSLDDPLTSGLLLTILIIPIVIILVSIFLLFRYFEEQIILKILLACSPLITLVGIAILSTSLATGLFCGLSVVCMTSAGWYLEFNKKTMIIIILLISILNPIFYFIFNFSIIYVNLVIVATFFTAVLAMLADRYLIDRIRESSVNVMIVTFALAIIFQSFVTMMSYPKNGTKFSVFGSGTHLISTIVIKSEIMDIFGANINTVKVFSLIVFFIVLILLFLFINYSRIGLAIKAVSQDEVAASLAGINIKKITMIVSGIGMGLVGLAAVLTSSYSATPIWNPNMGWAILIFAIVVVTLGGMGSLSGTVIASFILGLSTVFVSILHITIFSVTIDATYAVIVPLVIVLLVMVVKPYGLFGKKEEQN